MFGAFFFGEAGGVGDDLRERLLVQRENLAQPGDGPGDEAGVVHVAAIVGFIESLAIEQVDAHGGMRVIICG